MNATAPKGFPVVSTCAQGDPKPETTGLSSRKLSGQKSGPVFPFDPQRFQLLFPDRWMAFLHAHHASVEEVSFFYGVTDRAARKWWNGIGGPRGDKVALAVATNPVGFQKYLAGAK